MDCSAGDMSANKASAKDAVPSKYTRDVPVGRTVTAAAMRANRPNVMR